MKREEYQAYLASREWALLKLAVKLRAFGICERCYRAPVEQTHHLTYARVGHEWLDDLLGLCRACHEFVSAVSDYDPSTFYSGAIHLGSCIDCLDCRCQLVVYCSPWLSIDRDGLNEHYADGAARTDSAALLDLLLGHMAYARAKGNGACAITLVCHDCKCTCCKETTENIWDIDHMSPDPRPARGR